MPESLLSVKSDFKPALKRIRGLAKEQIPFATALALTKTAQTAEQHNMNEMLRVFKVPTDYTLGSQFVVPAKKRDGLRRMTATIGIKDKSARGRPALSYLRWQVGGGRRVHKGFELALIGAGIMQRDEYAIPSRHAKLNRFGNIPKATIQAMLSSLGAQKTPGGKRGKKAAEFYVGTMGRNRGIYRGRTLVPFIYFGRRPSYRRRFPFEDNVRRVVRQQFSRQFDRAFAQARASAR